MKKILFIILVLYFIGFVLFKTETIETIQWKEDIAGAQYLRTSYRLNLDNFVKYAEHVYKNAVSKFKRR